MKQQKGDPQITYEALIEDLDPGDSFCTTIIDILVKVSNPFLIYSCANTPYRNLLTDERVGHPLSGD